MLNFTVGPVMSDDIIHEIGKEDVPYFRTTEFSNSVFECERLIKKYVNSTEESKALFITGSGTASMDACVSNLLTKEDKALIVDGGAFGHRFVEICETYEIPHEVIKLEFGHSLTKEELYKYENQGFTSFLVQADETSSGVLYDIEMIGNFCKQNKMLLILDSISSFLCDEFDMQKCNVNAFITGSQKALALHPGLSIIVVDEVAINRINKNKTICYYLDLKKYLDNGKRGQTPFTPCVGIILQLEARLKEIERNGGVNSEIKRISSLANYFRKRIENYPFKMFVENKSNAVTALKPINENVSCKQIFEVLKNEYSIYICPSGGALADKVFRVGHIGNIKVEDYDVLFDAFDDLIKRGIIFR